MSEPLLLQDISLDSFSKDHQVAFSSAGTCLWSDFCGHVGAVTSALLDQPVGNWIAVTEDPYHMAVSILSLIKTGNSIVLPTSSLQDRVSQLEASSVGLLTDRADLSHATRLLVPDVWAQRPEASSWAGRDGDAPSHITLYTSGSTGQPQGIRKDLSSFQSELRTLEKTFGPLVADKNVFGSVSHLHIYGLLFRVLWPLCAGRPFSRELIRYPHELGVAADGGVFVSSPAFLKRFVTSPEIDGLDLEHAKVFSSGGYLPVDAGDALRVHMASPPIEVYGSTETGGIAYREAGSSDVSSRGHLWRLFDGVEILVPSATQDGEPDEAEPKRLVLKSPHVGAPDWFETSDLIRDHGAHRFELLGRMDRTVKIEEKRLSLDEMEDVLLSDEDIQQAALLTLSDASRVVLGAALVLGEAGNRTLESVGKQKYVAALKDKLGTHFERVTLPRRWRFVAALPVDTQGKLSSQALSALFQVPSADEDLPEVLTSRPGDGAVELDLRTHPDLPCFEGHFPDAPVVPGVVQVDWAIRFAERYLPIGDHYALVRLDALKFRHILQPNVAFRMALSFDPVKQRVDFVCSNEDAVFSQGRIVLRLADE